MSEEENKVVIAGAICAPPPETQIAETPAVPQPRQPTSLQGLLKFAMDATKLEDAPHESHFAPLDEGRKRFLQSALNSLTIDVIEELLKQMRILEKVDRVQGNEDAAEYISALETISDFVCDIDTANDFHKIGGFVILPPCLKCKSAKIRAQACNLLAELCQNNPYCQKIVLENGFIPILVNIVENDSDNEAVVKALYAISCNVRQNSSAYAQLIQYRGIQVFLETLKRNEDKFNTKICFLLNALCGSQPDFKSRLVFSGYIPVLFSLISSDLKPSMEHVLGLLLKLTEGNPSAVNECKQNKSGGKEALESFLEKVRGKEEFQSEEEYGRTIYTMIFAK